MTVDFSSYTRGSMTPPKKNLKYLLSKPLLSSKVTLCVDDEQDSPWLSLLPRFKVDTVLQWHVSSPRQMNPIVCPPSAYHVCGYSQTHNQPCSTDFLGAEDPPYHFTSGTWWMAAYIPRCTFCLVFWPQKIKPQGDGGGHFRFNLLLINLLSPSPPLRIGK